MPKNNLLEKDIESVYTSDMVDEIKLSSADITRNVKLFVLLGSAYGAGSAELQLALQPFLVYLNASNTMIGFVSGAPIVALLGIFLSPWITRHFRRKKKYFFFVSIPYLGMFFLIGLAAIFAGKLHIPNPHLLIYLLLLILASSFCGGFCSLPSQEYAAACIPMSHRGRQAGYSASVGGLAFLCIAALGGWVLSTVSKPAAFGYVIFMGWFLMQSGFLMSLFAKEVPVPVEKAPPPWSAAMFKAVWRDTPYMRFLVVYLLYSMMYTQTFVFVNIYGFNNLKMAIATAAIMATVVQITRIAVSTPFGYLIDKLSPKRVLPYSFVLASAAMLVPVIVPNQYGVYISIILSTAFISLLLPAQTALLLGIPSPNNRAGHYSIQLISFYAAVGLGTITIGFLCDILSYHTVFIILGSVALVFIPICKYMLKSLPDEIKSYS